MNKIKCTMCGKCCMQMDKVIESLPAIADIIGIENAYFPYSHKNGVCEKLDIVTNMCAVYNNRPIICDIQRLSEVISEKAGQNIVDILNATQKACEYLKST